MKSFLLFTILTTVGVNAQKGKGKDPYQYRAGDKLPDNVNPLEQFDKTPSWPSNFGGAAIARGPTPGGCAPFELIIGIVGPQLFQRD